ncbi:Uncharacterized protein, MJ0678-like [hydrothermal vent metagenome]|uniref:Uncharacterized protein, MJ0678-like n=1 Tax=hydrothermal vent metagenome TaxID=652676 RepID=A0A3B1AUH4_9ZZZZ
MRLIEVVVDAGHIDTIKGIAEQHDIIDCWSIKGFEEGRCIVRMLVEPDKQQTVLDAVQNVIATSENARVLILPVEATLPRPEQIAKTEQANKVERTREELYQNIQNGAQLNSNYLLMVVFSTIVATIGLLENNVAVIIGAMVIAPLLGPNIALSFATSIGDSTFIWQSFKTNIIGIVIALCISIIIGYFWQIEYPNSEILSRTEVGLDVVVLALVSGAAAVLSLTSGTASALVGVMVSVALLPPTVTLGLMLGTGSWDLAIGAGLLLSVNIVCVNLASKMVFLFKGVKPRTWLEKQKAKQSMAVYITVWLVALTLLVVLMKISKRINF